MQINKLLAILLALAVLSGYVFLYAWPIFLCWSGGTAVAGQFLQNNENLIFVATALSGLVGGVMAMRFNEKLPIIPNEQATEIQRNSTDPVSVTSASGGDATATAFKGSFSLGGDGVEIISALYAIGYFLVSIAAIVTWLSFKGQDGVPELIKNAATVSFGLFLAVVRSLFTPAR